MSESVIKFPGAATDQPPAIFLPAAGFRAGKPRSKVFGVIAGIAGVGKSHLVRQCALDPRIGADEIAVLMAEDSTATYGDAVPDRNIFPCKTLSTALSIIDEFVRAGKRGLRVPSLMFVDSASGIVDYQMQEYKKKPIISEKTGNRDKFSEFGDLGDQFRDLALMCRDDAPMDVIMFATTNEPFGQPPEYAIAGKLIPANLTRWTSFALYMKAIESKMDPEKIAAMGDSAQAPHRTIGLDERGKPNGTVINRFFMTQTNGEVQAKGHRSLAMVERAFLPDVLFKMKGGEVAR